MSEDQTSQDNTEDVKENLEDPNLSTPPEGQGKEEGKEESTEEQKMADTLYGDDKEESKEESKEDSTEETKEESDKDKSEEDTKEDSEDEDKDKEESKDEEKKDEADYKLAKPKDSTLGDADMERIAEFAKEQGLSKEAAQKLVEQENQSRKDYFENLQAEHKQLTGQWAEQCKNDKEIGGDDYSKNIELAKRVVHKFGTEEFLKDLDKSGYGNHPEVVRVFARIGRTMSNDELVRPGFQSGGERSMEDLFYGNKPNQ
jgi:hypothetical protein